jgi:hypothetical protein
VNARETRARGKLPRSTGLIVLLVGLVFLAIGIRADIRHEEFSFEGVVLGVVLTVVGAALLLGSTEVLTIVLTLFRHGADDGGGTGGERGSPPGDGHPGERPSSAEPRMSHEQPPPPASTPAVQEEQMTAPRPVAGVGVATPPFDVDKAIKAIEAPATPDEQYDALVSVRKACASLDDYSRSRLRAAVEKAKTHDGTDEHKAKRQEEINALVKLLAEPPSR